MSHEIIDISSNDTHPIDFNAVKASGVDAVMIKATEGTDYTNPDYEADLNAARAAGLKVAAYHYARFDDPTAEANHFHSVAGADAKILDRETSTDDNWTNEFLAALGQAADQEMTYGSASDLHAGATRGLLWSAAWGPNAPQQGEALWQYTDRGQVPGIQGNVDRSEWLGSEEQYQAFFSGNQAPVQPGVPPPSSGEPASQPNPPAEPQPAPEFPPFPGQLLIFPPGVDGNNVRIWQQRMQDRGWRITVDGAYGPQSKSICEAFQAQKKLTVDGIVGRYTWDAAWTAPITRP